MTILTALWGTMTRVLIVDDDLVQLRLTSEVAARSGFATVTASSGRQALEFLRRHVPESLDLFLTPLGTLFAVALGALFVFQPLGGWLSDALRVFALTALERGGAGTGFVLGGVFLPVVMAGVHHGITPINLDLLATTGTTLLLPICAMAARVTAATAR